MEQPPDSNVEAEEDTVLVFTVRSPQRILREGGSQAWVLNPVRARQCVWLVCAQNRHHLGHVFEESTETHGHAFLVGRISGLRRSEEVRSQERWLITISEYATIDVPAVWKGWRNPVRYARLADLGIDPATLRFEPLDPLAPPTLSARDHHSATGTLTIAEAKQALAATFGVEERAVEITIRG